MEVTLGISINNIFHVWSTKIFFSFHERMVSGPGITSSATFDLVLSRTVDSGTENTGAAMYTDMPDASYARGSLALLYDSLHLLRESI